MDRNTTNRAGVPAKSLRLTVPPVVSGREKSGAEVPRGAMVDDVRAMKSVGLGVQDDHGSGTRPSGRRSRVNSGGRSWPETGSNTASPTG